MSFDSTKVDSELGMQVYAYLKEKGVETPHLDNGLDDLQKVEAIKGHFSAIMETLGLDLTDDSLQDSPSRVAKMFVNEVFWGLDYRKFPKITAVDNKMGYESMVLEKNIVVQSNCEHHFVAIDGYAHVAYIPKNRVLGLSKLNRIVEYFSRRPQIQERLTEQIFYTLEYILDTSDIAVMVNAKHFCVKSRGVEDINSETITSKVGGTFKSDASTRMEFLQLVRSPVGHFSQ